MYLAILIIWIIILILTIFWQGSLLLATIFGSPIVYAYRNAVNDSLTLAGTKKNDLVVDLGCGDGRSLIIAAKEFGARGVGIDRSLFCYLRANINVIIAGESKRVKIVWGDFHQAEDYLKKADVVYLYLLNSTLSNIESWIFQAIGSKTKIVSLAFWFPNKKPIKEIDTYTLHKFTKARLYVK